jgi:adenylate kinase
LAENSHTTNSNNTKEDRTSNSNYNNDNTSIASNTDDDTTTSTSTNANANANTNTNTNANRENNTNDGNTHISSSSSSKRVIIGGIPGAGKTSVICSAVESIRKKGQNARVVVFGTEMFEQAKRTAGIKNRDELRKLAVKDQRTFQEMAARRISELHDSIVIVDTHIFVRTGEGYYYPGLPLHLLEIIKPSSFVMIVADALEIVNRRKKDTSRLRDDISTEQVQYEIDTSKLMVATCSILTGAPFIIVANNDNKMDEAVSGVAKVLLSPLG